MLAPRTARDWPIPSDEGEPLVIWLEIYVASLVILLSVFYFNERTKAGPIAPRTILVMSEMAALFALFPATVYAIFAGLVRRGR